MNSFEKNELLPKQLCILCSTAAALKYVLNIDEKQTIWSFDL